jgi:hypothetical protein
VGLESLLQVDLKKLLERIEEACGVKLPKRVVEAYLDGEHDLLFLRFKEPENTEVAEPPPTETPTFLFTDEHTGETTALEVLGASELLKELKLSEPAEDAHKPVTHQDPTSTTAHEP